MTTLLGSPRRFRLIAAAAVLLIVGLIVFERGLSLWTSSRPADEHSSQGDQQVGQESSSPRPTISGEAFQTSSDVLEPVEDGWPSEFFVDHASSILTMIKGLALQGDDAAIRERCFSADFSAVMATADLPIVHESPELVVGRQGFGAKSPGTRRFGQEAIDAFLNLLVPKGSDKATTTLSLKPVSIQLLADSAETTIRVESTSPTERGATQQTSTWKCTWSNVAQQDSRLVSAELVWIERAERENAIWFEDETQKLIGHTEAFKRQLSFGLQHWLGRIETAHGMNYFSKHGLALGDVNGDGRDDLYVCQPGGLPNRLFLQNVDGTLTEASQTFGVDLLDRTSSALLVDLDNDGDQDLVLSTLMGVQLYENEIHRRFRNRASLPLEDIDLQAVSAVDYDNDGDLDLYQLVDYSTAHTRSRQGLPSFVYHNANDGGANRLFQNNIAESSWEFRDVTQAVGLHVNNQRHSLAAAWCDFNSDGNQDLYIANDYGPNCLYVNHGGRFQEISQQAGVTDFGSGMSVSWGDYDRDGQPDLYVGNMFSSAGSRITTQPQFLAHVGGEGRAVYPRFAKGNSLFRNLGGEKFQEVSSANVEMGRWAWSSIFTDINNDGWEDLLVANGYITTDDTGDL